MTWIKICGITNLEDAKLAVDAGADALGFVFYEKSPRRVRLDAAREIVAQLPERVEKVGVFVGGSIESIGEVVSAVGLNAVQLHGGATADNLSKLAATARVLIVVPASELFVHDPNKGWSIGVGKLVSALIIDSSTSNSPGGTGRTFSWSQAVGVLKPLALSFKIVVAGGLNPENVAEAIHTLHPWGVDVASGTEAAPGKKDPQKVRAFVEAVRQADRAA
jgi:phosphoribosylanthranilate isomerase